MTTKIISVKPTSPQTLRAIVNFYDDTTVVLERSYDFSGDTTIESIYPQMKEDLNSLEKSKVLVANLGDAMNKDVDLSEVKSTSEIKAEADVIEKAKVEAEEAAKPVEASPTPEADASKPLG